jgi:hypothetical protein
MLLDGILKLREQVRTTTFSDLADRQ